MIFLFNLLFSLFHVLHLINYKKPLLYYFLRFFFQLRIQCLKSFIFRSLLMWFSFSLVFLSFDILQISKIVWRNSRIFIKASRIFLDLMQRIHFDILRIGFSFEWIFLFPRAFFFVFKALWFKVYLFVFLKLSVFSTQNHDKISTTKKKTFQWEKVLLK